MFKLLPKLPTSNFYSRNNIIKKKLCTQNTSNFQKKKPSIFKKSTSAKTKRGPVSWYGLSLAAVTGLGIITYYQMEKDRILTNPASVSRVSQAGKPAIGGPWVLVDQDGKPVTDATYYGQFTLLYFGFTYCPDICPSELVKVGEIIHELEKRKSIPIKPLFISVDPQRDSIEQLKHYSQDFHNSFTYLTGTPDQISKAAKAYRVYFSKADVVEKDEEDDYLVDHSIVLYLVAPNGEFLEFFTQKVPVNDIVDKIEKITKSWKK